MPKRTKPRPAPKLELYSSAVEWFRNRVPIRKDDWLELDRHARERSFTVAGVAKLDLINETLKAVTKAVENGETLEQFKKRVGRKLENAWGEERGWHLEVIFRNNVQAAYAHGREAQMREPEVLDERPFWMFSAILDTRTTEICRPLNGTVLAADDPFWNTHTPPLHHQCRSIKRALTPEQAERRGVAKRAPKHEVPQEGFGGADPLEWKPDLSTYPRNLVKVYRRKRR